MRYVLYNKLTGRVSGYGYTPQWDDLPTFENQDTGVIETDENPEGYVKVVDGLIVPMTEQEIEQELFPDLKSEAPGRIRQVISSARRTYITDLPGQDAIYQAKETEAKAYLAEATPILADYPLLSAEIGITAATATELANLWITLAQQWRSVAAQLEAARMTANASVNLATTVAEVDAALAVLNDAIANLA